MIHVVTDSATQFPPQLAAGLAVEILPQHLQVDGSPRLDVIDLSASEYGSTLLNGSFVTVDDMPATDLRLAYERAAHSGADGVVSVHVGSYMSSAAAAAQTASEASPIPVEVVDTRAASFGAAFCAWSAAERAAAGGSLDEVASTARDTRSQISEVFILGQYAFFDGGAEFALDESSEVTVQSNRGGKIEPVASVCTRVAAFDAMAAFVRDEFGDVPLRVAVGDVCLPTTGEQLAAVVDSSLKGANIIRYNVSPSLATFLGLGTLIVSFLPGPIS